MLNMFSHHENQNDFGYAQLSQLKVRQQIYKDSYNSMTFGSIWVFLFKIRAFFNSCMYMGLKLL
ncbi:hypothetical protein Syun_001914 [Stephania yunnanensis]|uniref:Uncharacterized protein n=1 Tax=Stephania yunnanensis TaxID=152371 RepID=A0AAP0LKI0_9MAGN